MTTAQAIKQLSYTIGKKGRITEKDQEALNQLIDFVNRTDDRTPKVFLKMYSLLLSEFLVNYPDIDFATTQLNKAILSFNAQQLQSRVIDTIWGKHYTNAGVTDYYKVYHLTTQQKRKMLNIVFDDVLVDLEIYSIENVAFHVKRNVSELWASQK
jgi:hypothetical protein